MMLSKYKQNQFLKKSNALELIPLQAVKSEITEDGRCQLLVRRFRYEFLNKLFKKSAYFRVKLDMVGSLVWKQIDGKKTIAEITSELQKNNENQDRLAERVVEFITSLYRKDLIKFVIDQQ